MEKPVSATSTLNKPMLPRKSDYNMLIAVMIDSKPDEVEYFMKVTDKSFKDLGLDSNKN